MGYSHRPVLTPAPMASFTYPTPPPISPSAQPLLGMALALNVLLAAGVHLGLAFGHGGATPTDELFVELMKAAPVVYLALLLPVVAMYGLAAAAWTGWSWWRVPFATIAGATLGLAANAWGMAWWLQKQGWPMNPSMAAGDARIQHLLFLGSAALLVMVAVAASLWPRWSRSTTPSNVS